MVDSIQEAVDKATGGIAQKLIESPGEAVEDIAGEKDKKDVKEDNKDDSVEVSEELSSFVRQEENLSMPENKKQKEIAEQLMRIQEYEKSGGGFTESEKMIVQQGQKDIEESETYTVDEEKVSGDELKDKLKSKKEELEQKTGMAKLEQQAEKGDPVAEEVKKQLDLIERVEQGGFTEREREIVGRTVKERPSLQDLGFSKEFAGRLGGAEAVSDISETKEERFKESIGKRDVSKTGGQRFVEAAEKQKEIQTSLEEGREQKTETVENLESNIESTESMLSDLETGALQGIETEMRGELQGEEAIEFLESRLEQLKGERNRVEEEFESFEREAEQRVQSLEEFRGTREEFETESLEKRPFKGVTTENVLSDLSPVERTALAVETGVTNPEDGFVGLFTEGEEGVREEVEERLGYIRGRTTRGASALDLAGESAAKVGAVLGAGAAGGIAGEAVAGTAGVTGGYIGSKVGAAGTGASIGRGLGVAADVGIGLWQGGKFAKETKELLQSGDPEKVERGQERLFQAGLVVPSAVAGAYQYRGLSQPSNLVSGLDEAVSGTSLEGSFVGRGAQSLSNVFDESVTNVKSFQSGRSYINEDSVVLDPFETGRASASSTDVTEGGVVGGFDEVTRRPETTIIRGSKGGSFVRGADPLRFVEVETSAGRNLRFATSTDLTGSLDDGSFQGLADTTVLKVGEDARVYDPSDLQVSRQLVDVEAEGGFNVVQEESVLLTGDEGSFTGRLIAGRGDVVGRAGDVDFEFNEESFVTRTEFDEGVVETRRGVGLMDTGKGAGEVESRTVLVDEDVLSQRFEGGFSVERGVDDFGVDRGVTDFAESVEDAGDVTSGEGLTRTVQRTGSESVQGFESRGVFTENLYSSVSEQAVRQYVFRNIGVDTGESVSPTGVFIRNGDVQGFEGSGLQTTRQTFETGEVSRSDTQVFGVRESVSSLIDEDVSGVGVGTVTGQAEDTGLDDALVESPKTSPTTVNGLRTGIRDETGVLSRDLTGLGRSVSPVSRLETSAFTGLNQRSLVSPAFSSIQGFEQAQQTGTGFAGFPGFPSTVPVEPGTGGGTGLTTPDLTGTGGVNIGLEENDVSGDFPDTGETGLRLGILSASAAEFLPGVKQASLPKDADKNGVVFSVEPEEFEETEEETVLSLETNVF